MNIFERLRRDAGKIPWGAFASVLTEQMQAQGGVARDVLAQVQEWATHLLGNAIHKWPEVMSLRAHCESPDVSSGKPKRCRSTAVVFCDVCGRKCCLAHSRIDYLGDAICEVCIGEAKARARKTDKPADRETEEEAVSKALKVLKLKRSASWDDIRAQYKKLVKMYNADRPQSDKSRVTNTERLKKINLAFEVLRKHFEEKKAAA